MRQVFTCLIYMKIKWTHNRALLMIKYLLSFLITGAKMRLKRKLTFQSLDSMRPWGLVYSKQIFSMKNFSFRKNKQNQISKPTFNSIGTQKVTQVVQYWGRIKSQLITTVMHVMTPLIAIRLIFPLFNINISCVKSIVSTMQILIS